jgi:hypothetical protein|nr:hypothetical protein [Butyricicoccus sp. AM28-25]
MGNHVLKAFFYIDAVKADKIRRKSYEKTIVIGNSIIVFVATMAPTVAFAAVAELEREYILQRQREGIAIAKTKGKYTGRKPRPLPDNFERVVARWRAGEITAAEAMRQTGLKPNARRYEFRPIHFSAR